MDMEKNKISNKWIARRQILDILLIGVFAVFVYMYASAHDVLEQLVNFSMQHEDWELDEFIAVSVFLVFALAVFAFRRWHEITSIRDELFHRTEDLEKALSEIKHLKGLLPICAECKNIRDDAGYWHQVEQYLREHTEAQFVYSICPNCERNFHPEFIEDKKETSVPDPNHIPPPEPKT